jgi:hypothetical protein
MFAGESQDHWAFLETVVPPTHEVCSSNITSKRLK